MKIVLFEDTDQTKSDILQALRQNLGADGTAAAFEPAQLDAAQDDEDRTYDDRLEAILQAAPYADATLILADRDLSKSARFRGLSVNSVAAAARRLAIPVCAYARTFAAEEDYEWRGRWEEGLIILSFSEGEHELARKAVVAARGFSDLGNRLSATDLESNPSPAKLLATLLGHPGDGSKIALYAVGDQNRLAELPRETKQAGEIPRDSEEWQQWIKKVTHFFGYWLRESLLRYPGVFANEVASASHLNIKTEDFRRNDVKAIFANAVYQGPFADDNEAQWWRGALDDIVASSNSADGLELANRNLGGVIRRSECSVDAQLAAGYYCIISREPVSLQNSKGNLSWFPRGADLTRVSNPKFEEYGPWLGS